MPVLPNRRLAAVFCLCVLVVAVSGQPQRRITIYTSHATFPAATTDRNGRAYVSALDVLRHLGTAVVVPSGKKVAVRLGAADLVEFQAGKRNAKLNGKKIDLTGPALLEGGDLLVPVQGLSPLLSRLLGQPAMFRELAGRLLVGTQEIELHAEIHENPPRLVLHFSRPVNPAISSEPGRLAMDFSRDPLVAPDATQQFSDKLITSATFSEHDGTAVLIIAGTAPLMATFSDDGKTIIVAAPPKPVPLPPQNGVAAASSGAQQPPATASSQNSATPTPRPRFLVVIDPAHGGQDTGAVLAAGLNEKDLTLVYARKLRALLDKAGVPAILLRDRDITVSDDDRAAAANGDRAAVFVSVHVGNVGHGVRTYTARLLPAGPAPGAMLPWDTAQVTFLDSSRALSASIAAQLARASIDHAEAPAQLALLDHITSAAVAVEFLPAANEITSLTSSDYQQRVCAAVAAGIAAERPVLEARR